MNTSLNVDQVFEHVKKICDGNRCLFCDKLDGCRMRHTCGHSTCDKCSAEDCLLCLSSPQGTTQCSPSFDPILTARVKNATILLETCQEVFHTDVYKRQRLSEQLKVEKEVFPDCIQAPAKYCNKRKSLYCFNDYKENKENIGKSYFPGEETSSLKTFNMENSENFVHDWLHKNEKNLCRKPFADLDSNVQINHSPQYSRKRAKIISKVAKENSSKETNTKVRQSIKFASVNATKKYDSHVYQNISSHSEEPCMKKRKEFNKPIKKYDHCSKRLHDESGIVMDDEPILIEDSQSQVIDKDREAWLAVLAADETTTDNSQSIIKFDCGDIINTTDVYKTFTKVKDRRCMKIPFYKKSSILETCTLCKNVYDNNTKNINTDQMDNVDITIESRSFITTIKVYKADEVLKNYKESEAQTDKLVEYNISSLNNEAKESDIYKNVKQLDPPAMPKVNNESSEDIFTGVICGQVENNKNQNDKHTTETTHKTLNKCIVIEESDSDIDSEAGPVEVTADIHRSCDLLDYEVLSVVVDQREHQSRPRRAARGLTPTSTDSSEKENFNPNRIKKIKPGKKYKK